MLELGLNEECEAEKVEVKESFWKRQFKKEGTKPQIIFDWTFGIVMPVICFAFDPLIFKSEGLFINSYLGFMKPFAYLLSFVSIMALMAWLIWGARLKWLNGFLAGLFLAGGLTSALVGIVMLPVSLLGLLILVGILGFTPFFTSIVYLRNGIRAYNSAEPFVGSRALNYALILTGLYSLVVPAVINLEIKELIDEMKTGNAQTVRQNAKYLNYVAPITNFDSLRKTYHQYPQGHPKRQAIAEVYEDLSDAKKLK